MSIDLVHKAIEKIEDAKDVNRSFAGPASDDDIAEYEEQLGIKVDPEYRLFLSKYGAGSFGFLEIQGIVPKEKRIESDPRDSTYNTQRLRYNLESPMGSALYVIGTIGDGCEWVLRSGDEGEGQSPVYSWDMGIDYSSHELYEEYASFGEFFLEKVSEAISFSRE
ncbi:MAG: SMI1/KNR4 family protein [Candidatus Thiodiazotropha endolucinida]